jgi:hypothetical protein
VANRPCDGAHKKYEFNTNLSVCSLPGSRCTGEAFLPARKAQPALRQPTTQNRMRGRRQAHRCTNRRSAFGNTLRFKDRFLPCTTNTLVETRQGCRFAQAAHKSCGSPEPRRDLGTCPTSIFLNVELVACCTSMRIMAQYAIIT